MTRKSVLARAAISAAAMALTCTFFIDLCNLVYRCGCRSLWAGAAMACNIHTPGVKHCPFCSHGSTGYAIVLALVLIPQLMVSWWPAHWDVRIRLVAALLVFPAMTLLAAIALGLASGYWT